MYIFTAMVSALVIMPGVFIPVTKARSEGVKTGFIEVPSCSCEPREESEMLECICAGDSLANTTEALPNNTILFEYTAKELEVDLNPVDFNHLPHLETLSILSDSFDALHRQITHLHNASENIFEPLINLKYLKINVLWFLEEPLPELLAPLTHLVELDLSNTRRIDIANLEVTLGGLQNNTSLRTLNLWNIQRLEDAYDYLFLNLSVLLEPLRNCPLENINLGYNGFRSIYPGLINYAPKLKHLVLSNNILMPLVTSSLFLEILMHPGLETVALGEQGFRPGRSERNVRAIRENDSGHGYGRSKTSSSLAKEHAEIETFLDYVGIGGQDKCDFFKPENSHVVFLFTTNHTAFCKYLFTEESITFGGIPCSAIPPFPQLIDKECAFCQRMPTGGSLKTLSMEQLNVYDEVLLYPAFRDRAQCFHENTAVEYVDISKNHEYGFIGISEAVRTPIKGLEQLRNLYISDSGLTSVNPVLFHNFPELEILDLSDNFLTFSEEFSRDLFTNNTKLRELNIAGNRIESFFFEQFSDLIGLEILNINSNTLREFQVDLCNLKNLQFLDLHSNSLPGFQKNVTDQLTDIALNNPQSTITIDLSNNELVCTCGNIDFIDWALNKKPGNIMFKDLESYLCLNGDSNRVLFQDISTSDLNRDCNVMIIYISVGIASTLAVVLIILAGVCIYKKRWRIRYLCYLARQQWRRDRNEKWANTEFPNDAFISYNMKDRFWVHNQLMPTLEGDNNLKLCMHLRDFLPGEFIEDQVLESIENSRKTVLILSPNFLKSNWCYFEMQMARNKLFDKGSDVLVLVLLKPMPKMRVTGLLARLLEEKVYLEWCDDEDGQKLFWAKLVTAIKGPRQKPFEA